MKYGADMIETEYNISIDPGGTGLGVAFWEKKKWDDLCCPAFCEVIEPSESFAEWHLTTLDVAGQLHRLMSNHLICRVYIEKVGYFDSHKGQTAARSEALEKLVTAYGAILFAASFYCNGIFPIPVNTWKGQLNKQIVNNRIIGLLPDIKRVPGLKTHAWDAVGVGLYAKGFLNQRQTKILDKSK